MIHIDISLSDRTFHRLQMQAEKEAIARGLTRPTDPKEPDPVKQYVADETQKALAHIQAARSAGWNGSPQTLTKFPKWLREMVKAYAKKLGTAAIHDSDNDVFQINARIDLLDVDETIDDFKKEYVKALEDEDKKAFQDDFELRVSATPFDQVAEMAELENHYRGAPHHAAKPKEDASGDEDASEEVDDAIAAAAEQNV